MHREENKGKIGENAKRCGAFTRAGTPCKNARIEPAGRCRMHGGASIRGVAHPNFKTGRFARDLLVNLQEDFRETINDPRLLELQEEIALLTARVQLLLRKGESGKRWTQVREGLDALDEALNEGDALKLKRAQKGLRETVRGGLHDWAHWAEISAHVEQIRRLKASEHKHRIDTRMAITTEQLAAETAAVLHVISENVKDKETLRNITEGLREVISGRGPGQGGAELN
jgi:hypothetical protein